MINESNPFKAEDLRAITGYTITDAEAERIAKKTNRRLMQILDVCPKCGESLTG